MKVKVTKCINFTGTALDVECYSFVWTAMGRKLGVSYFEVPNLLSVSHESSGLL